MPRSFIYIIFEMFNNWSERALPELGKCGHFSHIWPTYVTSSRTLIAGHPVDNNLPPLAPLQLPVWGEIHLLLVKTPNRPGEICDKGGPGPSQPTLPCRQNLPERGCSEYPPDIHRWEHLAGQMGRASVQGQWTGVQGIRRGACWSEMDRSA